MQGPLNFKDEKAFDHKKNPTMLHNLRWPLLIYDVYIIRIEEFFWQILYCCLEDCKKIQLWRERSLLQFVSLKPSWCPEPNQILRKQIYFLRGLLSLWWRNSVVTGFQRTPAEDKHTGTTLSPITLSIQDWSLNSFLLWEILSSVKSLCFAFFLFVCLHSLRYN